MKTLFVRKGIVIKSILAGDKTCEECYFGKYRKSGKNDYWGCKNKKVEKWDVPNCVFDYPIGKNRIYVQINKE